MHAVAFLTPLLVAVIHNGSDNGQDRTVGPFRHLRGGFGLVLSAVLATKY